MFRNERKNIQYILSNEEEYKKVTYKLFFLVIGKVKLRKCLTLIEMLSFWPFLKMWKMFYCWIYKENKHIVYW